MSNRWAKVVSRITGVHRAEPVPDAFVRAEITMVDLAPSALRQRLAEGLVVPAERVDAALSSYFRFANLAALRELAQLWLIYSVPDPVTTFLAARGISGPVNASVIVVGLEGSPADEWLIRYAAHLAGLSAARLQGVHVRALDNLDRPPKGRWRRTACSANWAGPCARSGPARASGLIRAARKAGSLSARDRVAPPLALVASADLVTVRTRCSALLVTCPSRS